MAQSFEHVGESRSSDVQDKIQHLKARAEDTANAALEEGTKVAKRAGEAAEDALTATRRFVEEQPLVAIGVVAAFACAVGALWKLSPRRSDGLLDRMSDYVEPRYQVLRKRI
ncbi:MAG TPA: hypothetical protein PK857_02690 [Hyphomicrobium sp.]|nr:hypothetical protein [Hyphomicrobium sp.]HRO50486.1 hypothetical protein [Hyphomicrobium sp.]